MELVSRVLKTASIIQLKTIQNDHSRTNTLQLTHKLVKWDMYQEQHEVLQSIKLISLMTIKLSSVSSRVTKPQLSILTPVSRNKRRPEEDSHLVRLSSNKRKIQLKMGQMFFGVSCLEVKSVT